MVSKLSAIEKCQISYWTLYDIVLINTCILITIITSTCACTTNYYVTAAYII